MIAPLVTRCLTAWLPSVASPALRSGCSFLLLFMLRFVQRRPKPPASARRQHHARLRAYRSSRACTVSAAILCSRRSQPLSKHRAYRRSRNGMYRTFPSSASALAKGIGSASGSRRIGCTGRRRRRSCQFLDWLLLIGLLGVGQAGHRAKPCIREYRCFGWRAAWANKIHATHIINKPSSDRRKESPFFFIFSHKANNVDD